MQSLLFPLPQSNRPPVEKIPERSRNRGSNENANYYEPRATILPGRLVTYAVWQGSLARRGIMPKTNKSDGKLTRKSSARLGHYIRLMVLTAKKKRVFEQKSQKWWSYKIGFITLTLPSQQIHSDKEIHEKCFKTFIRACKSQFPGFMYLYKAEVQDNGNLHYHVTTNTFIHHQKLRGLWNYYVNKLGYVDRAKSDNPNSTDVHSIKNHKTIESYLVSYFTKKDAYTKVLKRYHRIHRKSLSDRNKGVCELPQNYFKHIKRRVTIKSWDCSRCLKIGKCSIAGGDIETDSEIALAEKTSSKVLEGDRYRLIEVQRWIWPQLKKIQGRWEEYVSGIRKQNESVPSIAYI